MWTSGRVHTKFCTVAVWPENPFSPLLTRPQGPKGCQMKRNHSLNMPQKVCCAKIDPKLNKLQKTIKIEEKLIKNACFLKVFGIFFNLGPIIAHQISSSMLSGSWRFFWNLWGPWGRINSGDILILIFIFDISVWQRHLAKFFKFFKLKPDITFINFTCIINRNITL